MRNVYAVLRSTAGAFAFWVKIYLILRSVYHLYYYIFVFDKNPPERLF